jgi:hypothetical protein
MESSKDGFLKQSIYHHNFFYKDVATSFAKLGPLSLVVVVEVGLFLFGVASIRSSLDQQKADDRLQSHRDIVESLNATIAGLNSVNQKELEEKHQLERVIEQRDKTVAQLTERLEKTHAEPSRTALSNNNSKPGNRPINTSTERQQTSPQVEAEQVAVPDLSGRWGSNIGVEYVITQKGSMIKWSVIPGRIRYETGFGEINGSNIATQWSGTNGSGAATGVISSLKNRGVRIDGSNGVTFYRID